MTNKLAVLGIQRPGKVLFQKASVAANMSDDQKPLARATMDLHAGKEKAMGQSRLTGKLFDNAIQVFGDIYNSNEVNGEDGSPRAAYADDIGELRDARKTTNKNRG